MESFKLDTLDILSTVGGVILGVILCSALGTVLPDIWASYTDLVDFILAISAFVGLSAKRMLLPAPARKPDANPMIRMIYLLVAIVGSLGLLGALVMGWLALRDAGSVMAADPVALQLGIAGIVLLAVAMLMEQTVLHRA